MAQAAEVAASQVAQRGSVYYGQGTRRDGDELAASVEDTTILKPVTKEEEESMVQALRLHLGRRQGSGKSGYPELHWLARVAVLAAVQPPWRVLEDDMHEL